MTKKTTLTRTGLFGHMHRVRCSGCEYDRLHEDVRDAVNDYVDHQCQVPA